MIALTESAAATKNVAAWTAEGGCPHMNPLMYFPRAEERAAGEYIGH